MRFCYNKDMNIAGYVKEFGKYSFSERPFSVVDSLVLATSVYVNLEMIAPSILEKDKKPGKFSDINDNLIHKVCIGIFYLNNEPLIDAMRKSIRFKDIEIKYINNVYDPDLATQFFAATFYIKGVGHYIAFRGTDSTVVGWKEDLNTSVHKIIPAQLDALDYINIVSQYFEGNFYVGGHSKGGNLTLYSSITVEKSIQDRIIQAYTFDGNGLASKEYFASIGYERIHNRVTFLCPKDSVIGELFYNPKNVLICLSKGIWVLQHNPNKWVLSKKTGDFIYVKTRTKRARTIHRALKLWINNNTVEDRKLLIDYLVNLLGGIDKTADFFVNIKLKFRYFVIITKNYNKEERKHMKFLLKQFVKYYKESKKYYKIKERLEKEEENGN